MVAALQPDILNQIDPAPDTGGDRLLLDALTVLGAAVAAIRARLPELPRQAWTLIGAITGGRLLGPAPAG